MQIFLDTANVTDIKQYASWGIVDGVTTNPSLMAKEGTDPKAAITEITQVVDGPISVEVVAEDVDTMVEQARTVAAWHPNIYAKIPMTAAGLQAVKQLSAEGVKTNVTLVFSVTQALLAAKAGATLVSPFVGRVDDIGGEGLTLVADIVQTFREYGLSTLVLAASLRHMGHITGCLRVGADIATLPPRLLDQMLAHPQTDSGLAKFNADWADCDACQNLYQ